jgi:signal transduction histidine kinase/class 3 adenylate cyclase
VELRSTEDAESYEQWRTGFAFDRLRVLYYLGLTANPVFIIADVLLYRQHLHSLLGIRAILELGLLIGFLALRQQLALVTPRILLIFWVAFPNMCVVHMTMVLGGFTSSYYNGLNLVFLAAAVIVPVSWPSHLAAQLTTLGYYYSSNLLFGVRPIRVNAAVENSFFLVWTCVALLFSVYLYERLQRAEFEARLAERRVRRELEESNNKLLELDRLKSEFFANISHELRTPLTLSLGAFKTLQRASATSESQEVIQSGLRNTSRLLFLINEMLDLAKFDSGRAELKKQCIDFAALVRGVAANFQSSGEPRIYCRGVTEPIPVYADPRQMKKVLYNLFSNAFKFSDPDKGQVWVRLSPTEETIRLEVEDNGIGIPREHLERVFDRFTQVEGSATRRYEGSGIGLALVKEVVTHHGGQITVDSEVGRGSTFTIILPRGGAREAEVVPLEDEDAFEVPAGREETGEDTTAGATAPPAGADAALVLVADDNPDMRAYLERVLGGRYRVVSARDGAEGLDLAGSLRPDLILTDAMMPRMSGYDLLKAVRGDDRIQSTPVIVLTARAGTEARIESFEVGADDYISKPFDEHELLARIGNLIRGRARERELAELQKEKLARFLPPQLTELIVSGQEDCLKSHRTEVTVLFIDLRGFTAFVETAAPEEVVGVLREYHAEMGRVVSAYRGTLERFAGDSMMVFFNDPIPMERHAEQAVRMGLAMRKRVAELCRQWSKRGIELGAGIGVATGYATLGMIGFEGRQDYAAVGTVTNLAARLCSEAQHGQMLVSGRCLQLIEGLVAVEPVGELTLKGLHRSVTAYNVKSDRGEHDH